MTINLKPSDFGPDHSITYAEACQSAGQSPGPQCSGSKTCTVVCGSTTYYITNVPNDCTCITGGVSCPEPCHDIRINCNQQWWVMQSDYITEANRAWENQQLLKDLTWWAIGAFFAFALVSLFKNFFQQIVDGIVWRLGTELKKHDIILFDGEHGRIVKLGWIKTDFYLYKKFQKSKDGKDVPAVATTTTYANAELGHHKIERYIELINLDNHGIDTRDRKWTATASAIFDPEGQRICEDILERDKAQKLVEQAVIVAKSTQHTKRKGK